MRRPEQTVNYQRITEDFVDTELTPNTYSTRICYVDRYLPHFPLLMEDGRSLLSIYSQSILNNH